MKSATENFGIKSTPGGESIQFTLIHDGMLLIFLEESKTNSKYMAYFQIELDEQENLKGTVKCQKVLKIEYPKSYQDFVSPQLLSKDLIAFKVKTKN